MSEVLSTSRPKRAAAAATDEKIQASLRAQDAVLSIAALQAVAPPSKKSKKKAPAETTLEVTSSGITITTCGITRELPKREVKPGVTVALFNPLGDWELNEALGENLAAKVPSECEVLFMPDGKAQALLHVLGRRTGLPTLIAKKEQKPYMAEPVLKGVRANCMTSNKEEAFYLGADDAKKLSGKKVMIIDDVVSTGGSVAAMRDLMKQAEATDLGVLCALTEDGAKDGVTCLGNLPVNDPKWA